MEIFMWWLDLDPATKKWLQENPNAPELPLPVVQGIAEAGGPHPARVTGVLTDADWDFVKVQSDQAD